MPENSKPKDLDEYKKWLRETHNQDVTRGSENRYTTVARKMKSDLEESEVWTELVENLREFNDEYRSDTGYPS